MSKRLAVEGGSPVRRELLPYGRQSISDADIRAVVETLRSGWLTTGPKVGELEAAFADRVGTAHAVVVSSGTAALHAAMDAAGLGPGDEVIVPAITFAATANAALYCGARPVFADVIADTLLVDPASVAERLTSRTRAVVAVDYAGQACDYARLQDLARRHELTLLADACHALGARYRGGAVGSLADLSTFSFHPVKHVTTAEGGAVTTDNAELAARMRRFRNHGISRDHRERSDGGTWRYDMEILGYNYRLSDLQCALGTSQLSRLDLWVERRREIAAVYDREFAEMDGVAPLSAAEGSDHAYHLYVVRLPGDRGWFFEALRAEGIGVNVHYLPVHLHSFYRQNLGTGPGLCPVAEGAYERIVSLPIFPAMGDGDVRDVVAATRKVTEAWWERRDRM